MITGVLMRVLLILATYEIKLNRYVSDVCIFEQVEKHPDGARLIHLLSIGFEHSGEIKCTAVTNDEHPSIASYSNLVVLPLTKYTQNGTTSSSVSTNLYRDKLDQSPAHISKGPEDCVALIGGNVTLKVHYIGVPQPIVKWLLAVSKYSQFILVHKCVRMRIL